MADKIKYNLKNVYYAVWDATATTPAYGTPVALPGAVSLSISPEGQTDTFYADGMAYYKSMTNNGYSGDLEIALIPDAFRKNVLGEIEDTKHNLVEKEGVSSVKFALGFQVDGDVKGSKFWYYNCTVNRPDTSAKTKEATVAPETEKLSWENKPDESGYVKIKSTDTTSTSDFTNWFNAVVLPNIQA